MVAMIKRYARGSAPRYVLLLLIAGINGTVCAMGKLSSSMRPPAVGQEDLMYEADFLAGRVIAALERSRRVSEEERESIVQARLTLAENAVALLQGMTRQQINGMRFANGMTFLMEAARNGRVAVVHQLLHQGADASLQDARGRTAYDYACEDIVAQDIAYGGSISRDTLMVRDWMRRAFERTRGMIV